MSRAHYPAQSAHNTEKHPAHYPEQNTKPGSLKAIAGAVLKRSSAMCECADPRNAHSHITSDNCTLPRTLPAHCNNDTPLTILQSLLDRGFDVRLDTEGGLLVTPGKELTDTDRAAIRANLPALKRLVSSDYTHHPEGWSIDQDMPGRAVHVRNGRLIDSCLLRTAEGALVLIHRLTADEPLALAFHAACAFEDAQQPDPHAQRRT